MRGARHTEGEVGHDIDGPGCGGGRADRAVTADPARRRPDRRCRHLRDRRGLPPQEQVPGASPSSCSTRWRASAARGGPTATPASGPTATCSPSATGSSRGRGPPIATAEEILRYLDEVIDENDLGAAHPLPPPVTAAGWSTEDRRWTVEVTRDGHRRGAAVHDRLPLDVPGLLRPRAGLPPEWEGLDRFAGRIVHPQQWPDDLDYAGKRVVVIGSGATAATLIPAIAESCGPRHDAAALADVLLRPAEDARAGRDAARAGHPRGVDPRDRPPRPTSPRATRSTRMSFESPDELRTLLLDTMRPLLPEGFDVDKHFNPALPPLAAAPRGRSRRRPVHRAARGQGLGRHRHDRGVHRDRHPARLRARSSTPTSSSPPPAST